ncbi:hypothetical protein, partial [Microbacterium sp.]
VMDLALDPALQESEVVHETPVAGAAGSLWTQGRMARLSRTEARGVLVVPGLGEHTREVLREAGLADEAIDRMLETDVAVAGDPYAV